MTWPKFSEIYNFDLPKVSKSTETDTFKLAQN